MGLSIIIVNYEAWDKLKACLESLLPLFESNIIDETIVVDNDSPTDRFAEFQSLYKSISFHCNSGNRGFAHGCNYGASLASGDIFLFLNPDTIINSDAIVEMSRTLRSNPEITILSCSQTNEKGDFSKASGTYKQYAWSKLLKQNDNSKKPKLFDDSIEQVEWVSGSVFMISKDNFETYNGWNEDYWMYCEDEDFCRRVNRDGGSVYLLKNSTIIHSHGGSSRINIRTAALTKTEVLISTHQYFHNFLKSPSRLLLNTYMVVSRLFSHLLLAIIALPLFFVRKMRIKFLMLFYLLHYYSRAMLSGNWKSPRIKQ